MEAQNLSAKIGRKKAKGTGWLCMRFWASFFSIFCLACFLIAAVFVIAMALLFQIMLALVAIVLLSLDGFALAIYLVNKKFYPDRQA